MADSTAGGRQVDGFHGISIEYMRSRKFMHADGGYDRVVWMPDEIKEQLRSYIPEGVVDKIATEKDARTIPELQEFLRAREHPVTKRWKTPEPQVRFRAHRLQVFSGGDIPLMAGGFRIILKNARITAEKIIIQPVKSQKSREG